MRIGLRTWGSDGDIRPHIALASGLSAKGHEVTLVSTNPERKDYAGYGKTINIKSVTSTKLLKEIGKVLNSAEMKNRAGEVGKSMQKENGVARAVELIEKYLVR